MIFWVNLVIIADHLVALSLIVLGCAIGNVIVIMMSGFMLYALMLNQILIRHEDYYLCMNGRYPPIVITELFIASFFILFGFVICDVIVVIVGSLMFNAFLMDKFLAECLLHTASYYPV